MESSDSFRLLLASSFILVSRLFLIKKFMLKELLLMRMFLDIKSVMQSIVISLLRLQVYLGQQLLVL